MGGGKSSCVRFALDECPDPSGRAAADCGALTDCASCTAAAACAFCPYEGKCVEAEFHADHYTEICTSGMCGGLSECFRFTPETCGDDLDVDYFAHCVSPTPSPTTPITDINTPSPTNGLVPAP